MAYRQGSPPDPFQVITELNQAFEDLGMEGYQIMPVGEHGQFGGYTRLSITGPGFDLPEQAMWFDIAHGGPTPSGARTNEQGQLTASGYAYQLKTKSGAAYQIGDIIQAKGPEQITYEQAPTHMARVVQASFAKAEQERQRPGKEDVTPKDYLFGVLAEGSKHYGVPGGTLLSRLSAAEGQRMQYAENVAISWGDFEDYKEEQSTKDTILQELQHGTTFGQWLVGWGFRKDKSAGDRLLLERFAKTGREEQGPAGPIRTFESMRGKHEGYKPGAGPGAGNIKHLTTYMGSGEEAVPLKAQEAIDPLTGNRRRFAQPMKPQSIDEMNVAERQGAWQVPIYARLGIVESGETAPRNVLTGRGLIAPIPVHPGAGILDPTRYQNIFGFGEKGSAIVDMPESLTMHQLMEEGSFHFPRSVVGRTVAGGRERQHKFGQLAAGNISHDISIPSRSYDFVTQGARLELPPFYNPTSGAFSPTERAGFVPVSDVRPGADVSPLSSLQQRLGRFGVDVTATGGKTPHMLFEGYGMTSASAKRFFGSKFGVTTSGSGQPMRVNLGGSMGETDLDVITQDIKQITESMKGSFGLQPYEHRVEMLERVTPGFGQAARQMYPEASTPMDIDVLAGRLSEMTGSQYSPAAMFQSMYYSFQAASPEENLRNLQRYNTGYLPESQYVHMGRVSAQERQLMMRAVQDVEASGAGGQTRSVAKISEDIATSSAGSLLSEEEIGSIASLMAADTTKPMSERLQFQPVNYQGQGRTIQSIGLRGPREARPSPLRPQPVGEIPRPHAMYDMSAWITGSKAMVMPMAMPLVPEYQGRFNMNTELMFSIFQRYPGLSERMGAAPWQGPLGTPATSDPLMKANLETSRKGWMETAEAFSLDLDAQRGRTILPRKTTNIVGMEEASRLQQILPGMDQMPREAAMIAMQSALGEVFGEKEAAEGNYMFRGVGAVLPRPSSIMGIEKFSTETQIGQRESVAHASTLYLNAWRRLLDVQTMNKDEEGVSLQDYERIDMAQRAMYRYREVIGKAFEGKGVLGQLYGKQYAPAMGGRYQVLNALGPTDVYMPQSEMRRLADMAGVKPGEFPEFQKFAEKQGGLPGLFARYPTVSRQHGVMPVTIHSAQTLPKGIVPPESTKLFGQLTQKIGERFPGVPNPFARGTSYISAALADYFVGDEDMDPYAIMALFGRRAKFDEEGNIEGSEFVSLAEGPEGDQFRQDLAASGNAMSALQQMFGGRADEFSIMRKTIKDYLTGDTPTAKAAELRMADIGQLHEMSDFMLGRQAQMGTSYNVRRRLEASASSLGLTNKGFETFFEQSSLMYQEPLDIMRARANEMENILSSARVTRSTPLKEVRGKRRDERDEIFQVGANVSTKGELEWKTYATSETSPTSNRLVGTLLRNISGVQDTKDNYLFSNESLSWMFAPNPEAAAKNLDILNASKAVGPRRWNVLTEAGAMGDTVSDLSPMGVAFAASVVMNTRRKLQNPGDKMADPGAYERATMPFAGAIRPLTEIAAMPQVANTIDTFQALTKDRLLGAERISAIAETLPEGSPLKALFGGIANEWGLEGIMTEQEFDPARQAVGGMAQQELFDVQYGRGPGRVSASEISNLYAMQQGQPTGHAEDVMLGATGKFAATLFRGAGLFQGLSSGSLFKQTGAMTAGNKFEKELVESGKVQGLHIGKAEPMVVQAGDRYVSGIPDLLRVDRSSRGKPTSIIGDVKLSRPDTGDLAYRAQVATYHHMFGAAVEHEKRTGEGGVLRRDLTQDEGYERMYLRDFLQKEWVEGSNMPGFDIEGFIEGISSGRTGAEIIYPDKTEKFSWKGVFGGRRGFQSAVQATAGNIKENLLRRAGNLEALVGMNRLKPEVEEELGGEYSLRRQTAQMLGTPIAGETAEEEMRKSGQRRSRTPKTQAAGGAPPSGGGPPKKTTGATQEIPPGGTEGASQGASQGASGGAGQPPVINIEYPAKWRSPGELSKDVWKAQLMMQNYRPMMPELQEQVRTQIEEVAKAQNMTDDEIQQLRTMGLPQAYSEVSKVKPGVMEPRLARIAKPLAQLSTVYSTLTAARGALKSPDLQEVRAELEESTPDLLTMLEEDTPETKLLSELAGVGAGLKENLKMGTTSNIFKQTLADFESTVTGPKGALREVEKAGGASIYELAYGMAPLDADKARELQRLITEEHAESFYLAKKHATAAEGRLDIGPGTYAMSMLAKELGVGAPTTLKGKATDEVAIMQAQTFTKSARFQQLSKSFEGAMLGIVPDDMKNMEPGEIWSYAQSLAKHFARSGETDKAQSILDVAESTVGALSMQDPGYRKFMQQASYLAKQAGTDAPKELQGFLGFLRYSEGIMGPDPKLTDRELRKQQVQAEDAVRQIQTFSKQSVDVQQRATQALQPYVVSGGDNELPALIQRAIADKGTFGVRPLLGMEQDIHKLGGIRSKAQAAYAALEKAGVPIPPEIADVMFGQGTQGASMSQMASASQLIKTAGTAALKRIGQVTPDVAESLARNVMQEIQTSGLDLGEVEKMLKTDGVKAVKEKLEEYPELIASAQAAVRLGKRVPEAEIPEGVKKLADLSADVKARGSYEGKLSFTAEEAAEMLQGPREALIKVKEASEKLAEAENQLTAGVKGAREKVEEASKAHEVASKELGVAKLEGAQKIAKAEIGELQAKTRLTPSEVTRLGKLEEQDALFEQAKAEIMQQERAPVDKLGASGASAFFRKFLGGFGLFYIGTLLGLGKTKYQEGYAEGEEYQTQMEAMQGRMLGTEQMDRFSPEIAHRNALALSGGTTYAGMRRFAARNVAGTALGDISGNVMSGFGGYALSLYAATAAQQAMPTAAKFLMRAAPGIGLATGLLATGVQQAYYVSERDTTEMQIMQAQYKAATMEGTLGRALQYGTAQWKGLSLGVANLVEGRDWSERPTISLPQYIEEPTTSATSYWSGDVKNVWTGEMRDGKQHPWAQPIEETTSLKPVDMIAQGRVGELVGMIGTRSDMPEERREEMLADIAQIASVNSELADKFDIGKIAEVFLAQLKVRGDIDVDKADSVLRAESAGLDLYGTAASMFTLTGGGLPSRTRVQETTEQLGEIALTRPEMIARVQPGIEFAARGRYTMRELAARGPEAMAAWGEISTGPQAELATLLPDITETYGRLGIGYQLPGYFRDPELLKNILSNQNPDQEREFEFAMRQQRAAGVQAESARDQLGYMGMGFAEAQQFGQQYATAMPERRPFFQMGQGIMQQALGMGLTGPGVSQLGLAMGQQFTPNQARAMQAAWSANPIALTNMAMGGLTGMNMYATADIGAGGQELTGLPLFTSSLWQGTTTPEQTASMVWGQDWLAGDRAGIRGSMVSGVQAPWNPDVTLQGLRGAQVQMNQLQHQASMAGIGNQLAQLKMGWAFQTGVGINAYNPVNPQTGQPFGFNQGNFAWNVAGVGGGQSQGGGFWGMEDVNRQMGYAQQQVGFDFSKRQMQQQQQQFSENMSMNMRQFQMGREQTQTMWGFQDQQRGMTWEWRQEDFQEQRRFLTGRDRRLAERQMRRETTMHDLEGEQIDVQRQHQRELWNLEEERFDLSKRHFMEGQRLQKEQMDIQERFFEERKRLEDEQVKMQRAYATQQHELQLRAIGTQAHYAKLMKEAQDDMIAMQQHQDNIIGKAEVSKTLTVDMWDLMIDKANEVIGILSDDRRNSVITPTPKVEGPIMPKDEEEHEYDPRIASVTPESMIVGTTYTSEWNNTIIPPGGSTPDERSLVAYIYLGDEFIERKVVDIVRKGIA